VQSISAAASRRPVTDVLARIDELTEQNRAAYADECVQLNPAENLHTSGIGLPGGEGDAMNGLPIGTNEIVRSGSATYDMDDCAALIAAAIQTETPDTSRTRCLASASGPPASTS
jgi:hypothetical protein